MQSCLEVGHYLSRLIHFEVSEQWTQRLTVPTWLVKVGGTLISDTSCKSPKVSVIKIQNIVQPLVSPVVQYSGDPKGHKEAG